jgi:hypothetical protein
MFKQTLLLLAMLTLLFAQNDAGTQLTSQRVGGFEVIDLNNRENTDELKILTDVIEKSKELYLQNS